MNFNDRIRNFNNYALTTSVGIYDEDSMTAQQLNIKSANKIIECLKAVEEAVETLTTIKEVLKISYEEGNEELTLTLDQKVEDVKNQVNGTYTCIFDENAMSNLEQAGNMARAVNECVKTVNMFVDLVTEIEDLVSLHYDPITEMLTLNIGGDE